VVKKPPVKWLECPHPVYGLACELPASWSLDVVGNVAVAAPRGARDDTLVALVQGERSTPAKELLEANLPIDHVALNDAHPDHGTALLNGKGAPLDLELRSFETSSGSIVVVTLSRKSSTKDALAEIKRINASFRVVEPPVPPPKRAHDLAGRPIEPSPDVPGATPSSEPPMPYPNPSDDPPTMTQELPKSDTGKAP
jgi:hypothetical protein